MSLKLRSSTLGSYGGPCLPSLMVLPNSDKLAWVVPFGSGFAVHVLCVQNHRAGAQVATGVLG